MNAAADAPPASHASVRHAAVALPVPVRRLFTYAVDEGLAERLGVGSRVRVPLGNRRLEGTVVAFPADPPGGDVRVRSVEAVIDDPRRLPDDVFELTAFVAEYYLCSRGDAIEAALPPRAGTTREERWIRRAPGAQPPADRARAQVALWARLADGALAHGTLSTSERRAGKALLEAGKLLESHAPPTSVPPAAAGSAAPPRDVAPTPTAGQAAVLQQLTPAIRQGGYRPFLLHGATGSGKTEVYFRAAEETLRAGRGVIYLVPEIGLTPLLLGKVERRFPDQAAVLHSGLPATRRFAAWRALTDGRRRFAVGTRSAIFAPVADVGLIVVDEEQDSSYKQEETPRYNARDLALVRGRAAGATVVLGSATPSMESYHAARHGRYELLDLGGRILERPLPEVELVDMREVYRKHGEVRPLSDRLMERLGQTLSRGEQAIVLRNRRGWSAALVCPRCGNRVECPRCSVAFTWHEGERRLRCHYCDARRSPPEVCETCGHEELAHVGQGSEQIESLLQQAFPDARLARMDRDTIRRRGAHEALLKRFSAREIDVLVGTQMVAKGHDFPAVTLVGVLSADQSLGIPDFRAGERTFQLLTQVAGRAGRGTRPGRVVIQAFDLEHPVLRHAATQQFESFYEREIRYRRALRYPPLSALVRVVISDTDPFRAREHGTLLAEAARQVGGKRVIVQGPAPAPLSRLRGRYREQVLLRSTGRRRLVAVVAQAIDALDGEVPQRSLQVDVDPYSML